MLPGRFEGKGYKAARVRTEHVIARFNEARPSWTFQPPHKAVPLMGNHLICAKEHAQPNTTIQDIILRTCCVVALHRREARLDICIQEEHVVRHMPKAEVVMRSHSAIFWGLAELCICRPGTLPQTKTSALTAISPRVTILSGR